MSAATALVLIRLAHTIVWVLMAGIILALPWFIARRRWKPVAIMVAIILAECAVLVANGMRCPLTDVAARYTTERAANFDIYLPLWLAAHNQLIFGTLFAMELAWATALGALLLLHRRE